MLRCFGVLAVVDDVGIDALRGGGDHGQTADENGGYGKKETSG